MVRANRGVGTVQWDIQKKKHKSQVIKRKITYDTAAGNVSGEGSRLPTDEPATAKHTSLCSSGEHPKQIRDGKKQNTSNSFVKRYKKSTKDQTGKGEKKGAPGKERGKGPKPTNKKTPPTRCQIPQPPAASDIEVRRRPVRRGATRKRVAHEGKVIIMKNILSTKLPPKDTRTYLPKPTHLAIGAMSKRTTPGRIRQALPSTSLLAASCSSSPNPFYHLSEKEQVEEKNRSGNKSTSSNRPTPLQMTGKYGKANDGAGLTGLKKDQSRTKSRAAATVHANGMGYEDNLELHTVAGDLVRHHESIRHMAGESQDAKILEIKAALHTVVEVFVRLSSRKLSSSRVCSWCLCQVDGAWRECFSYAALLSHNENGGN